MICLMALITGTTDAAVQEGDWEVDALGTYMQFNKAKDTGNDENVLLLLGSLGYFLTDNIQICGAAIGFFYDPGEHSVDNTDLYGLGIQGKWHFVPQEDWIPYIGYQLFWGSSDSDNADMEGDGLIQGPVAGVRYALTERVDLVVEGQYHMYEEDLANVYDDGYLIAFGLKYTFE